MANRNLTQLRVKNTGTTDYVGRFDGNRWTISPGSEAAVPYDAACLWAGDPSLVDTGTGQNERGRTDELARVQVRCGYHDGVVYRIQEDGSPGPQEGEHVPWDSVRPPLEFFTFEGTPVPMVADAPDGPPVDLFGDGDSAKSDQQRIAELEGTVRALAARVAPDALDDAIADLAARGQIQPPPDDDGPPVDSPSKPKVGAK